MGSFGKFLYSEDGSTWAPADIATVPQTPPSAPRTLTATVNSSSQITLSWLVPTTVGGMQGYMVRYKAGSAPTSNTDGTLLLNTTSLSYVHTGLSASTTYGYRVVGYTGDGQYGTAATTTGTTLAGIPSAPLNMRITGASYNALTIAWDAPSAPAALSGYQLRYNVNSIPGSNAEGTFILNTTSTSYTHGGLGEQTYYGYRVFGYIPDGSQGPGATTAYTTPARPTSGGSIYPSGIGSGWAWTQSTAKTLTGPNWSMPVNGYITGFNLRITGYGTTGSCNPHIGGNYLGWRDLGSTGTGSPGWSDHGVGNWYFGAGTYSSGCSTGGQSPKASQWQPWSGAGYSTNVALGQLNYWYYTASWVKQDGTHIDTHTDTWQHDGETFYERVYEKDSGLLVSEVGDRPDHVPEYVGERLLGVTYEEE